MTTAVLAYAVVSLVVGGGSVTYEIWHRPLMLDNADGRGKFPSPKMQGSELLFFGVFVALCWPVLAVVMFADARSEK